MEHMESVFSPHEAARQLVRQRQASEMVAEFSIRFHALAGETGWPEAPFMTQLSEALQDPIQDALAVLELAGTSVVLISTAIRIGNRIRDQVCTKNIRRDRYTSASFEPFSTHLSPLSLGIHAGRQGVLFTHMRHFSRGL